MQKFSKVKMILNSKDQDKIFFNTKQITLYRSFVGEIKIKQHSL